MHTQNNRTLEALVEEHANRYVTESEALLADFEGLEVIEILKETGRCLGLVAGETAAGRAMLALLEAAPVFHHPHDPDQTWDVQLQNVGALDALKWPAGHLFFELNAYAYGGFLARYVGDLDRIDWPLAFMAELYAYIARPPVAGRVRTEAEREAALEQLIEQCAYCLARIPTNWKLDLPHLRRTLSAAQARWALDHDEPVHPDGLARLGRLNPRTLRNRMSGGQFSPVDGRITPEEARAWLAKREDFRPSIWREQGPVRSERTASERPHEEYVLVPVARDGSVFHAGLAMGGKFTIGDPQERVAGFREALGRLQQMPTPKWWRPNKKNCLGLVAGVRWERKLAGDLDVLKAGE